MPDKSLLIEANAMINGDRAKEYGNAAVGLGNVAAQWRLYLSQKYNIEVPIDSEDVCWMMADLKKVRQLTQFKRDNVVDAAGYLGLIERVK